MAQPTLESVELNAGAGGAKIAVEQVGDRYVQAVLAGYSTGDGTMNVVAADAPLPVAGSVAVGAQPARARTTDTIAAAAATDAVMNGTAALAPKWAKIGCAAAGANELVAGVSGKKIRVLQVALHQAKSATAAAGLYFRSGASTAIYADATYAVPLDKTGAVGPAGFVLPPNPLGWFETASGEALNVVLDAAQGVSGALQYVEV